MMTLRLPMCILSIFLIFTKASGAFVGVNLGTDISKLPPASDIVSALQAHQINHVRLYNTDHQVLKALMHTEIEVMVGVPNDQLTELARSKAQAENWIKNNVAAFAPAANITHIAVGNEVLSTNPRAALSLVPAMQSLHSALLAFNLSQVKVSSPQSMDMISNSFPPSKATFNSAWKSIMVKFLQFLKNTGSPFMLNAHPYYAYTMGNRGFPVGYALFESVDKQENHIVDPNTLLQYSNMFDQMLDATYYSMQADNFSGVRVIVTESGWPWHGGDSEPDATVDNALIYNRNLIRHVLSGSGTPSHPNVEVGAYIYELFNEDLSPGLQSEKNWGFIFPNGTDTYSLSFGIVSKSNTVFSGNFCVVNVAANLEKIKEAMDWACGLGGANCSAVQTGQPCYEPSNIAAMASYAFNDYYQKKHALGGNCDFNNTALTTTVDPSHGSCIFTGSSKQQSPSPDVRVPPASALAPGTTDGLRSGVSAQVLQFSNQVAAWVLLLSLIF